MIENAKIINREEALEQMHPHVKKSFETYQIILQELMRPLTNNQSFELLQLIFTLSTQVLIEGCSQPEELKILLLRNIDLIIQQKAKENEPS
jgi:hypothetical protein